MAIGVMTWVWNHSRSRHGARLVLLAIADCASADGGNAWPSNAELRRKSGLGERAVQTAIAELTSLGELEVRYNAGPKGCNAYRVIMSDLDPRNICTPAESAPPQKMRGSTARGKKSPQVAKPDEPTPAESAPPQILRPTPAESAPVTVLEPKPKNDPSDRSRAREPRGTRIPDDFTVTPEMVAWARKEAPRVDGRRETERFVNYWRSAAGAKARKVDWALTWRNWMLKAEDDIGARPQQRPTRQQETDQLFDNAMQLARQLDAREAGIDPRGNGHAYQVHQSALPPAGN